MFNWLASFINKGSISQTNIETQNIYYTVEVETLLKSIDGYFNDGNISEAFELLDLAISKSKNKEYKYPLLLKKVEYLLEVRNIDDANKVLNLLSKDYAQFIDVKYKEQLLFIYSLEKKEKEFFQLIEEIKAEKEDIKPDDYFQIIYCLNSLNLDKAKNIYNSYSEDKQEEHYLIGGHLFANLYNHSKDHLDLEKATKFYQIVLEKEANFLLKIHIDGFFVQNIINDVLQNKNTFDKSKLLDHKINLKKLFKSKKYFNKIYINQQINFYAFILLTLEFKDEYIQFYEAHANLLFNEHCLQYYHLKNIEIEHIKVQNNLKTSDTLLINYASLMRDKNEQKVVLNFFEANIDLLLKFDLLIYFYVQAIINLEHIVLVEIDNYIVENKSNSFELYMSFLLIKFKTSHMITDDEINTLLGFVQYEKTVYAKVIETIDLLVKIKKSSIYIEYAISKINNFKGLTKYVLQKCFFDMELKIEDFELFIENIDKNEYAPYIADIYSKYGRYYKSFEYFQINFENNQNTDNAINLLIIGIRNYEISHSRINEEIENEVLFYLQSKQRTLSFNNISLISYYSLVINKDKNNAFGIINKKILELNVYELNNDEKQQLSSLYFNSITNFGDKEIDSFEKNTIFIKNKIYYLDKEIFKNINKIYIEKFNIALIDRIEIQKINDDSSYEKKSLFHFIVNQILETIDSPYFKMIKIDLSSKNPFEEMQKILIEQSNHTENQLQRYSDGAEIGFWTLAGGYDKYFNLIVKLIEDENLNFQSCKYNIKDNTIPKLLTLSSIIFLHHNNRLEDILKREDVYIQRTSYNWLVSYIQELEKQDELFSVFAKDGQFYKDIVSKDNINLFSNRLKEIINNIDYKKIVDDTKASLPFKEAFNLSQYFGIQEYQALSFSFQHNYQIITEDRLFEVIFETLKFNQSMISNSLSLLDKKDVVPLGIKLNQKKYKYVFDTNMLMELVTLLTRYNIVDKLKEQEIEIIKILDKYDWIENIKRYYLNNYKVLYPKMIMPKEDYISKNIEYMLQCLEKEEIRK